jgi:hypothetical protein
MLTGRNHQRSLCSDELLKGSCMINDEHTQVHGETWLVEDVPPFRFFVS